MAVWWLAGKPPNLKTANIIVSVRPFNGEELTCLREEGNDKDHYAVAVTKSGSGVVGHVQRRISAACALFLQKGGSIIVHCVSNTRTAPIVFVDMMASYDA